MIDTTAIVLAFILLLALCGALLIAATVALLLLRAKAALTHLARFLHRR